MKILFLFLLSILSLAAEELPTYKHLSSLTNPEKLAALKKGNRAANSRFKKLMYWMHRYEESGVKSKEFLSKLYAQHGNLKPYSNENHVYAPVTEKLNWKLNSAMGSYTGFIRLKTYHC